MQSTRSMLLVRHIPHRTRNVNFFFWSVLQRVVGRVSPALGLQVREDDCRAHDTRGKEWRLDNGFQICWRERGCVHVLRTDRVGFRLDTGKCLLMESHWEHSLCGWWGEKLTASLSSGLERTGQPCTSVTPSSSSWSCCCRPWA